MPTYEYECPQGHSHALQRTISHRGDPAPCPKCGSLTRRIVSLTAGKTSRGKGIDVSNITGVKGQRAYSAREADAIADKHGQIIIPKSEYKNRVGPMSRATKKEEIKRELEQIDRSL